MRFDTSPCSVLTESKKRIIIQPSLPGFALTTCDATDVIGFPPICTESAPEIFEYQPTRKELVELAKYWAEAERDVVYGLFLSGCYAASLRYSAVCRLNEIAREIGVEAVRAVEDQVWEDLKKREDPKVWRYFIEGIEPPRCKDGVINMGPYSTRWQTWYKLRRLVRETLGFAVYR